ncbi:hypothetical protein [Demequina sp.]|uniref:hypothetical protein n=1 Tax=Demequina sp. TaxID=2050685 RepID=UPI003D10E810
MRAARILAPVLIAALAGTVLAAPALADDSPELTVTGLIGRTADVEGTFIVAGNSMISIQPDAVAGLAPGTAVEASLAIPAKVAKSLRVTGDVDAETAKGAAIVEAADAPLAVTDVTTLGPTAAAAVTTTHYIDVAVNINGDGVAQPSDSRIKTAIATASAYWKANTGGAFPGFTVRTIKRYYSSLACGADDEQWAVEAANKVGRDIELYFSDASPDHLVMIGECRHDEKAALGTIGDSLKSGGVVIVQADFYADPDAPYFLDGLLVHELGHNFSLDHANAVLTQDCDFSDVPAYTALGDTCDTDEYGDWWSLMGFTMPEWWAPLLDIARRDQLGVAPSTMLAKHTGLKTATYTVYPLGKTSGNRGIKITAPSGKTFYVEYRDGTGEKDALYMDNSFAGCTTGFQPSTKCSFDDGIFSTGPGVRVLSVEDDNQTRVEAVNTQTQEPRWAEQALDAGEWWRSAEGDVNISILTASGGKASIAVTTLERPYLTVEPHLTKQAVAGQAATVVVDGTSGATYTYRWFRSGKEISGATAASYTVPANTAGQPLTVRVEARKQGYAPTQAVLNVPVYAGLPTITGTLRANEVLTAVKPSHVPADATLAYQWLVNGTDVPGATGATFSPLPADAGGTVSVRVAATWSGGSDTVTSDPRGPIALATNWSFAVAPSVSGTFTVGSTLTASAGGTSPASTGNSLQWYRDNDAIPGATGSTYVLTQDDYGAAVSVAATHTLAGYVAITQRSAGSVVDGGVANTLAPSLVAPVRVGAPVAVAGQWARNFALSYQWLLNGEQIPGATGATYVPTASDLGGALSVTVTGTHPLYGASAPLTTDAAMVEIGVLTAPTPVISGTALVGKTLTAVRGTWTSGATIKYQWYANGVAIGGATKSTYKVSSLRAGKKITVRVTGSKAGYTTASVVSAAKGVPVVGKVTISGRAKVGSTLTAKRGTWLSGTTFTYQWYANGVAIGGATKSTYKVSSLRAGKYITVKVTGKKSGYTTVSKTSAKTAKVVR